MKNFILALTLLGANNLQAFQFQYAEDVEHDLKKGCPVYKLTEQSQPMYELYYDFENQSPAECELSSNVEFVIRDMQSSTSKYLLWNNRLIKYPGEFLDAYFSNNRLIKTLDHQLSSSDLGKLMIMTANMNLDAIIKELESQMGKKTTELLYLNNLTDKKSRKAYTAAEKELQLLKDEWLRVFTIFNVYTEKAIGYDGTTSIEDFINDRTAYGEDLWYWVKNPETIFENNPEMIETALLIFNRILDTAVVKELTDHRVSLNIQKNEGEFFEYPSNPCLNGIDFWMYIPSKEKSKYGETSPLVLLPKEQN